jgi:type IV pilus assembly protein PilA
MLARIRKAQENNEGGFTLIELLVVMIIIGILAAIAIPAFLSQKNKGYEASEKSDLRSLATEVSTQLVDQPGAVAISGTTSVTIQAYKEAAKTTALGEAGVIVLSPGNELVKGTVLDVAAGTYCLELKNTKGKAKNWKVEKTSADAAQSLSQGSCA